MPYLGRLRFGIRAVVIPWLLALALLASSLPGAGRAWSPGDVRGDDPRLTDPVDGQ